MKSIELSDYLDYGIKGRKKSKITPRFGTQMVEGIVCDSLEYVPQKELHIM